MSIVKVSASEMNSRIELKVKQTILINVFLMTIVILAALDLVVTLFRGDSLAVYTKFLLVDFILSVFGVVFCSDLLIQQGQKFLGYFYSYMLFLWSCLTIIKLVCFS
ncbi:hypothetical protein ACPUYX_16050 [Desulfosporosinus sp. SYSU MS00001]|uniref:hypothetical protein n=1 Tax=Desulfosporosinus sp. SYSU MS00001 TaxID=3416284 RepID=UPI003CE847D0